MPSTNKTSLGLNKWLGTDKPQREDFNKDNDLINTLLTQKADKNKALQTNLYAQYAYNLASPSVLVNKQNLFTNPPLKDMAMLDHRQIDFAKSDNIVGAPPAMQSLQFWETLTIKTNYTRALQIAAQCYDGSNNGHVYLRTRHVDNDDFTQWQAWREVATCYCADAEWKILPLINGFVAPFPDHTPRYRKILSGDVVCLSGIIRHTATSKGATFAQLPAGFRPKIGQRFAVPTSSANNQYFVHIVIDTSGNMRVAGWSPNADSIVNDHIDISITFPI